MTQGKQFVPEQGTNINRSSLDLHPGYIGTGTWSRKWRKFSRLGCTMDHYGSLDIIWSSLGLKLAHNWILIGFQWNLAEILMDSV